MLFISLFLSLNTPHISTNFTYDLSNLICRKYVPEKQTYLVISFSCPFLTNVFCDGDERQNTISKIYISTTKAINLQQVTQMKKSPMINSKKTRPMSLFPNHSFNEKRKKKSTENKYFCYLFVTERKNQKKKKVAIILFTRSQFKFEICFLLLVLAGLFVVSLNHFKEFC